jgi:hypothetical protein
MILPVVWATLNSVVRPKAAVGYIPKGIQQRLPGHATDVP